MKFHIKFWWLNDKKVTLPRKNLILGNKPGMSLKVDFLAIGKNRIQLMCYFGRLHDAP